MFIQYYIKTDFAVKFGFDKLSLDKLSLDKLSLDKLSLRFNQRAGA
jgi:hypothetical protein